MGGFVFIVGSLLLVLITFVLDHSWQSAFVLFHYFSISVVLLLLLLNFSKKNNTFLFFFFGLLIDWYYKFSLGISSLLTLTVLYIFILLNHRVAANRWGQIILNTLTTFILYYIHNGYTIGDNLQTIISTGILSGVFTTFILLRN